MVIKDDPIIISHFNEFEKSKDFDEFYNQLIALAPAIPSSDESSGVNTPTIKDKGLKEAEKSQMSTIAQISSPLDSNMLQRKRDFDKEVKHPIQAKVDSTLVKKCDMGKSPEMIKLSLKDKLNKS
jgi:hypothetical protein